MNPTITYVIVMAILVLLSGYFSATETAFSSLNKTRLKTMVEKGNKKASLALALAEQYDKLLSTILIGNNIVNISLSAIATVLFIRLLGGELGPTISTVVITVVVLIFGEITPKSLAKDSPEKFALFSAPLIRLLIWVLTPINFIFSLWKKLLTKLLKTEQKEKMSQEELLMFVEEVQQEGSIDDNEGDLLRNAIEFTERRAEDILTHRIDLEAVPIDATKEEIARKFAETRFSRILVYEETIDKIVGVIHQKDFYTASGITGKRMKDLITPTIYIQKAERINDLLRLLQKHKTHIAVVVDEYGGTLGIVTMEDILEELVGEIWDEHDEVVEYFTKVDEDTFSVDCSVNIDEFSRFFDDMKIESDSVSLGGLLMEIMECIPSVGDSVVYQNLEITVTETDGHRVARASVKVIPPAEESDEESEKREEANAEA